MAKVLIENYSFKIEKKTKKIPLQDEKEISIIKIFLPPTNIMKTIFVIEILIKFQYFSLGNVHGSVVRIETNLISLRKFREFCLFFAKGMFTKHVTGTKDFSKLQSFKQTPNKYIQALTCDVNCSEGFRKEGKWFFETKFSSGSFASRDPFWAFVTLSSFKVAFFHHWKNSIELPTEFQYVSRFARICDDQQKPFPIQL